MITVPLFVRPFCRSVGAQIAAQPWHTEPIGSAPFSGSDFPSSKFAAITPEANFKARCSSDSRKIALKQTPLRYALARSLAAFKYLQSAPKRAKTRPLVCASEERDIFVTDEEVQVRNF